MTEEKIHTSEPQICEICNELFNLTIYYKGKYYCSTDFVLNSKTIKMNNNKTALLSKA